MKILLINIPQLYEFTKETTIPLGLASVAACIRKKYEVRILDLNVERISQCDFEKRIVTYAPHMVGFSVTTPMIGATLYLAKIIKKLDNKIKIVFGGPHPSALPGECLQEDCVDYAVIGEGEKTIVELIDSFPKSKNLKFVRGIGYKIDSHIFITKPQPLIQRLDELPAPAFDLFPVHKYTDSGFRDGFYLMTSRGCPYSCIYCSAPEIFGRKLRRYSIKNVIGQLKILKIKYDIKSIKFNDDIFTFDREYVVELCKEMIRQNTDLLWWCNTRVDKVDRSLLELMHKAGCIQIPFGIESGSQRILNFMKKGTTVKQAKEAIKITREVGIVPSGYFMVNFPTETHEEIKATFDLAKRIGITYFRISIVTPYPKTALWTYCINKKLIKETDNYSKYGYLQNILISNPTMNANQLKKMVKKMNLNMFFRYVWFSDSFKAWIKATLRSRRIMLPIGYVLNYLKNLFYFNSKNAQEKVFK